MLVYSIEMAICRACKCEIHADAKLCTHCGQYQDWRRFFGRTAMVLSLFVALISVLTAAAPVFRALFVTQAPDLSFKLEDCRTDGVDVFAINTGNRAALVTGAPSDVGSA